MVEFGGPPSVEGWIVDSAQFFAVNLAVVAMVVLIQGYPLAIGSSDRGARFR
jgi:hypothetical protein